MNKAILSVVSGLAIAAPFWIDQNPSFLSGVSFPNSRQAPTIPTPFILGQSDRLPGSPAMTTDQIGEILSATVENLDGSAGQWQFEHNDVSMVVITNDDHNRIRLVAPITSLSRLTSEQREKMLFANFHTTLDARYAIGTLGGEPVVVSVFVHPLSSLSEEYFQSALNQVGQSAQTFGTTYSSGELLLSPGGATHRTPENRERVRI